MGRADPNKADWWQCCKCKKVKHLSNYNRKILDGKSCLKKWGVVSYCKECEKDRGTSRYNNDQLRLGLRLRSKVRNLVLLIYNQGVARKGTAENLVGCTVEEFTNHLGLDKIQIVFQDPDLCINQKIPFHLINLCDAEECALATHYTNLHISQQLRTSKKATVPVLVQDALEAGMSVRDCLEYQKENPTWLD